MFSTEPRQGDLQFLTQCHVEYSATVSSPDLSFALNYYNDQASPVSIAAARRPDPNPGFISPCYRQLSRRSP
jgi:hypothetical protein